MGKSTNFFGQPIYCQLIKSLNLVKILNQPDSDLKTMLAEASESPPYDTENI